MRFDCGHSGDNGKLTARGAVCLACVGKAASRGLLFGMGVARFKAVVSPPKRRRTRGEVAAAERAAYEMYREKLPDYDDKLRRMARALARSGRP